MGHPKQQPNISMRDLASEIILFTGGEETVHVLNPTARIIWNLCDGNHSPEDMAQALQSQFSIPNGYDVLGDVQRTLSELQDKDLLQFE